MKTFKKIPVHEFSAEQIEKGISQFKFGIYEGCTGLGVLLTVSLALWAKKGYGGVSLYEKKEKKPDTEGAKRRKHALFSYPMSGKNYNPYKPLK
jgi:hypothetical protein